MAAVGYFSSTPIDYRSRVIYKAPLTSPTTTTPTIPTSRLPATGTAPAPNIPMPRLPLSPPKTAPLDPVVPYTGGIITETTGTMGGGSTTGGTTSGGGSSTGTSPGTTTGAGTGGATGGGDTSRLLDLLSGAFQTQPITQGYAPQSVSSDAISPSGGSNPGALLFLGILALVGVVWYMNRKKRAA